MDILDFVMEVFNFTNLLWLFIGATLGVILGAIPGLSADTGIAIFLPITFNLEPVTGLITLGAIYVTASYGGNITAVLVNTPGTSDSLFMVFDGYPMTLRGDGLRAIGITTWSAFIGGIIGSIALLFIAPLLARIAVRFGPWELFLTTMMGIVIIVGLSKDGMLKGLLSASFGFLCSLIGVDGITGVSRFHFGIAAIYDGLPLLPVVLGMFAVSQVFVLVTEKRDTIVIDKNAMRGSVFLSIKDHASMLINNLRSAIIGTIVGIIPAAGTTVAAGISYDIAKRTDPHPETFGKGNEQGLASVSAANNAVVGGSLVPLLTLGIPGNGTSALFLGGLIIHGLCPGTQLFTRDATIVYGLFAGLIAAQFFILLFGLFGAPLYSRVTRIPKSILVPIIASFCVLGAYSGRFLYFDMYLILFFGVVGYYMVKANFPMAPFVLAFVLGRNSEIQFRRALMLMQYDFTGIFFRPLSLVLLSIVIIFLVSPFWGDINGLVKKCNVFCFNNSTRKDS